MIGKVVDAASMLWASLDPLERAMFVAVCLFLLSALLDRAGDVTRRGDLDATSRDVDARRLALALADELRHVSHAREGGAGV